MAGYRITSYNVCYTKLLRNKCRYLDEQEPDCAALPPELPGNLNNREDVDVNILGYLQKVGRALMVPVATLPAAAILMGVGYWIDPVAWGGNSYNFV